jgi:hypothetical protein
MREAALLLLGAVFASLIMAGGAAWASRGYAYHRVLGGLLRRHRRGRLYNWHRHHGRDGWPRRPNSFSASVATTWCSGAAEATTDSKSSRRVESGRDLLLLSEPTLEVRHNRPPPKVASRMTQDAAFSSWTKPSSELLLIGLLRTSPFACSWKFTADTEHHGDADIGAS